MTTSESSDAAPVVGGLHPLDPSPAQVEAAVVSFAMLADPTRVRMLWAMASQELDVASQHMSKLRLAGLVKGTRDGRRILYRSRGGYVRNLLREKMFHADHRVSGEPVHD